MDENFRKFKRRVWIEILIKCLSVGLAAAALAVDVTLLPCKLCGVNLLWIYYVLIALGAFSIGGGIAFVFLRTDDKKIVKRLDAQLNLNERVQSAYEFGGESGDMYDMLRGDAGAALGKTSVKALPFKNIIATVLCAVVGVAGVIAAPVIAGAVPSVFAQAQEADKDKDKDKDKEPPRDVTDWEWAALDDLISYVEQSVKWESPVRSGVAAQLKGLKNVLLLGVSQSSLEGFVRNTVNEIRNVVKDAEEDATDAQKALNAEEENYVVTRLFEIFSLLPPGGEDDPNGGGDNKGDDGDNTGGGTGTGELNINDVPFFDPEKGYVKVGEVRDEYYERVQLALEEGTISKEEWEFIMATYFADLNKKEDK